MGMIESPRSAGVIPKPGAFQPGEGSRAGLPETLDSDPREILPFA
jgi:hypothetical protein